MAAFLKVIWNCTCYAFGFLTNLSNGVKNSMKTTFKLLLEFICIDFYQIKFVFYFLLSFFLSCRNP